MNSSTTHPLQSPAWGKFRKAMGVDVAKVNGWLLTFHRIPLTPWTIGYFPRGPKPSRTIINKLTNLGDKKHAIFIQLEPNEIASLIARNDRSLRHSHRPLFPKYTFVLDLTKSEEELMKAMHPKTRYNIRVAQKHGVAVGEDNSPKAFEVYLRLMRETTQRQGFLAHNETYHRMMWKILSKTGVAKLWTATYQGKILAAWIIFCWKDTIYYPYGSSSREDRDVMAPNLLLWEITRWAKKDGYKKFDLWGALGPNADEKDPWYGFHRFKEGYHPDLVEFIGSYDFILKPLLYRLFCMADDIRRLLLRMK